MGQNGALSVGLSGGSSVPPPLRNLTHSVHVEHADDAHISAVMLRLSVSRVTRYSPLFVCFVRG